MKKRESNIELLRILATCAVILLHYNDPSIGEPIKISIKTRYIENDIYQKKIYYILKGGICS